MENIINLFKKFWEKANKKKVIGAAIALAIVLVATIGLSIWLNSPTMLAGRTISRFANDFSKRDEISTITNTLTKGSLEASMSSISVDDEEMLEDFSASGKIYFGSEALMLENLKLSVEGFDVSGDVYLSPDLIYVQEDEILGEAYGIERENLASNLEDSIFAYGSGSKYELFDDEEMYNALLESLDASNDEKMVKDAEKIIKNYTKALYKSFCKHGEITVEKDKIKVDGKNTNVRITTITVDEKSAAAVAEDMLNYIVEDDSIIEFLENYESKLSGVTYALQMYLNIDSDSDLVTLYEEMIEELEESIDDIVENIEDADFDLAIEMATPKNSAKLLKLDVKVNGEKMVTVDVGAKGIKNSQKITISSGGEKMVYEIKEKSGKVYKANLKFAGEELLSIDIDYGKEEFSISVGEDISVKGEISKKGKTFNIAVKKIEYSEYDVTIKTDLELVVKTKDKMPKAPNNFTTIDQITEEDIDGWGEKIREMTSN